MKNSIKNVNKPIQLQVALVPVCKMVMRFGLHFNEFVRNLQKAYIHAAEEILESQKIKPNLQAIAIKTGMDRRTIAEHYNSPSYSNPLNKMDMVIIQLQLSFSESDKQFFTQEQLQNIIDSIYAKHIRANAIIKELLSNKIIVKVSDRYKLNLTLQQQLIDIRMMAEDVDFTAKRLFQTFYKNMFNSEKHQQLKQSTSFSTRIPTRHHHQVNQLLKKELRNSEIRIRKILHEFETNIKENSYPEIGITQFQFNSHDQ